VHRHEIYEEIKSTTLGAAASEKVDLEAMRRKARRQEGDK
jgi:sRNA-binding carbon storage regulator CsrA